MVSPLVPGPYDSVDLQHAYIQELQRSDGDVAARDAAQSYLAGTHALYHGSPSPWGVVPKIFSRRDLNRLALIVSSMHEILETVTRAFVDDPGIRAFFALSPSIERAVMAKPRIDTQIPIGRYDIFLNELTGDFTFCEINTDGSASSVNTDEITAAIQMLPCTKRFASGRHVVPSNLVDGMMDTIEHAMRSAGVASAHPALAIVDYIESLNVEEARCYIERFAERGVSARISDIRSLHYEDGRLRDDVGPIDAIWRRVVVSEMEEKPCPGSQALLDCACDGTTPIIGSFRSWPAATKTIFAALFTPLVRSYLTREQIDFIDRHVPRTYLLTPKTDISPFLDKDAWILKPRDGYASHGVIAGSTCEPSRWMELLREYADTGGIVQTYAPQYCSPNAPGYPAQDAVLYPYSNMEGLFAFNGKLAGVFTRCGTDAIIDYTTSRLNLGCLVVEDE